jgi:hypothetical protein
VDHVGVHRHRHLGTHRERHLGDPFLGVPAHGRGTDQRAAPRVGQEALLGGRVQVGAKPPAAGRGRPAGDDQCPVDVDRAAIRLVTRSSYGRPWSWHDELDRAAEAEVERLLQRDVEEAELLELSGTVERADVDGAEPAVGGQLRHRLLGGTVVAGDEDVELLTVDLAGHQGGGEGGVERLHDRGSLRDELLDLLGGGGSRWRCQPVPGLGVDGVGDVDDDLAGELVRVRRLTTTRRSPARMISDGSEQ